MSATEFTIDLNDIRFVIHDQLRLTETLQDQEIYADCDRELYDTLLEEAAKISVELLAPLNRVGDRQGCGFDGQGNVTTPPGYKAAWEAMSEAGWFALGAPEEDGGTVVPHTMAVAANEMFTGACVAFATYPGLTRGVARLMSRFAPQWLRDVCVTRLFGGEWAGTMCLTEAGAGTAVGDNRTRALKVPDSDTYHLIGEKVFITAGDQDITNNIIHLVLARVEGAPAGIKGLSIFAVPKFHVDRDGGLGARNGVFVTSIEEKMGLHGSATCTLAFGAEDPCLGYLLGEENQGIKIMFHLMNEARIGVGIQGLSGAAGAYQNALSYAQERIQGVEIDKIRDFNAPRVPIVVHPDVRRMLMWQRVHIEAIRSLLYTTALRVDQATHMPEGPDKVLAIAKVELLTPICKAHCTDVAFEACCMALQTFGGYGYIGDYPVEQYVRDTKIASIYEGTNGVQAMDLVGRKMRQQGGMVFMAWMSELNDEIDSFRATGIFDAEVAQLEAGRDALGACAMHLGGLGMQGDLRGAFLQATPMLTLFGTVVLGLHSLIQARTAHQLLQGSLSESEQRFCQGKILNARFYSAHVLPRCAALAHTIQCGDQSCLDPALFTA